MRFIAPIRKSLAAPTEIPAHLERLADGGGVQAERGTVLFQHETLAGRMMRRSHQLKDDEPMTGIQYVTDLKKCRELWEDIEDLLVSRSRRHEKLIQRAKQKRV
jgi:hypothetical protein